MISKDEEYEQILQACLALVLSGRETIDSVLARYPEQPAELRMQLEAALWLQSYRKAVAPDPEFIFRSRERLVTSIQAMPAPPSEAPWESFLARFDRKHFTFQVFLASVLLVCLFFGTSIAAVASHESIPGDPLYLVKISLENTQLALTSGDAPRAQLHIAFAERRLGEIRRLIIEGRFDHLHKTVNSFESQTGKATALLHSLAARQPDQALAMARDLDSVMQEQSFILPGLLIVVPPEYKTEIRRLTDLTVTFAADAQGIGAEAITPTLVTLTPPLDTPTAIVTPVPSASDSPVYTPSPSTMTGSSTPVGTELPTVSSGGSDPTALPMVTEQPIPTRKPTHTMKPLPNPTRRPPKPTKKP